MIDFHKSTPKPTQTSKAPGFEARDGDDGTRLQEARSALASLGIVYIHVNLHGFPCRSVCAPSLR